MNNQNYNPFDEVELSPQDTIDVYKKKEESPTTNKNPFEELDFDEEFWKNAFRTASQIPQGIAEATPYGIGAGLFQMLALGETELGVEEWHKLRELSEQEGIPFDEEAYEKGRQEVLGLIPTVSNISRMIEEKTGIPLQPRTQLQKGLRLGSAATKFQPGTVAQKATAGVVAPATSLGLQEAGVPEPVAELAGLATGGYVGAKSPAIDISKVKKPSGLVTRQYEKLTKPREISKSKHQKITSQMENEFREINDKIIVESPISKTAEEIKSNPEYKQEVSEQFEKVHELAKDLPEKMHTNDIKKKLIDSTKRNKEKGFVESEYEADYNKNINKIIEKTKSGDVTAENLVDQYRKNNESLGEAFEPGQSKAYNRGKRDALLDHNKAISEVIKEKYPDSEFSKLFENTNKQWTEIRDVETINEVVDSIFEGGVKFKEGRKALENKNTQRILTRALGKEGKEKFNGLMKDMLESESAYKMLKVADKKGYGELAEIAGSYVFHPQLGHAKAAYSVATKGFKAAVNAMLDKPQLAITWERGVKNLKKGNFSAAEKDFKILNEELKIDKKI